MYGLRFKIREDVEHATTGLLQAITAVRVADPGPAPAAARKKADRLFVMEAGQGKLLQMVLALNPPRRFPGRLHGREQNRRRGCR